MLRSLIFILFILFLSGHSFGQERDWPISAKHKRKLEKITDKSRYDKLLAKYLRKDTIKQQKKIAAQVKRKFKRALKDSLTTFQSENNIPLDSNAVGQGINDKLKNYKSDLGVKNNLPDIKTDSTAKEQIKTTAKSAIRDSLDNYIDVPDVKVDSTLKDQVKSTVQSEGKEILQNELGTELPNVNMDSTIVDQAKTEALSRGKQALGQELGAELPNIKLDSTAKDQVKSELKTRGKQALQDELGADVPDITLDSTTVDQLAQEAERRAAEALQKEGGISSLEDIAPDSELGKLDNYKKQFEQSQQQLKEGLAKQKIKEKMAASAKKFIQDNAQQISQVQSKMGELKKKYSYVPNSNDLSTAKKRSSLKGESFWKRLVIGGNFNVSKTNPLRVDLSPVIGYKINKLFEIGVTGAYRAQFKASKSNVAQTGEEVYGFSIFADHMVFKNFFGHLEGEQLKTNTGTVENESREWKQTLLVGIGRKFNVAKWLEMQALVLYNPLHGNTDGIYNSPVVFKTGIRVRK